MSGVDATQPLFAPFLAEETVDIAAPLLEEPEGAQELVSPNQYLLNDPEGAAQEPARLSSVRERMKGHPVLAKWFKLQVSPETKEMSPRFSMQFLTGQWTAVLSVLIRLRNLLDERGRLSPKESERASASLKKLQLGEGIKEWAAEDARAFLILLGQLEQKGVLDGEELKTFQETIRHGNFIIREYRRYQEKKKLLYHISLWSREEEVVERLHLSPTALDDLSVQVLVVRNGENEIVGGMVLRLFQNADDKKVVIFANAVPLFDAVFNRIPQEVKSTLTKIATAIGLEVGSRVMISTHHRVDRLTWSTQIPHFPVTAHLGVEEALRRVRTRFGHPHEAQFGPEFKTYEAMRRTDGTATIHLNRWLEKDFSMAVEDFARREVEPEPDVEKAGDYLWGFVGGTEIMGSNGRSVDFFLGAEGVTTPDGTRWHHLSSIGGGATNWVRAGRETRDGKLSLEEAIRRFYLTNLMHAVAGPYGFRTSLGLSLTDYKRIKKGDEKIPGVPHIEAKIDELRREQWRLSNLNPNDPEDAGAKIDAVCRKVARELGKKEITREEYVRWFAKTLGEQFAIMEYFGFDHGLAEKIPQLGPWNVSLMGEIFDNDTGRFVSGTTRRYVDNTEASPAHVDSQHIHRMQENWEKDRTKKPTDWASLLLYFAPGFDFHATLLQARRMKAEALRELKINVRERIGDFNRRYWVPFIKQVRAK